ncbi:OmpL47-type beta-barrel domain-containing protein [Tumebacillus permanentifrigoris]|uniref:Fibronectin type-III domain-containing protein n=1 Tax=Tumebacillus permanentifrigoris TaxID=378543 RepID=A0A316DCQ7_9BACL|nr:hypothetical protein [Tumebacillus permanentifrigoris]PWK14983.1 hypothetical protein C7459_104187 [Tumebacillus permanentifrigoris]
MGKRFGSNFSLLLALLLVFQLVFPVSQAFAAQTNAIMLPPSNLAAQQLTPDDVKLSWSAVFGATGYNVYGIMDGQLKLLGSPTTAAFTINDLPEGSYSFVVSTLSADGESGPCAPVNSEIVYPDMAAPASLTSVVQNGTDVVLNWAASQYADSYKVYQITADDQKTLVTTVTTGTAYTFINAPGGSSVYAVSASNALYGESPVSTTTKVDVVPPKMIPPTGFAYTVANGNDVTLKWNAAPYATSYKLYKVTNGQNVLQNTVTGTTVTLTNQSAGDYAYEVHATSDRYGDSADGTLLSFTLVAPTMAAPANLKSTLANYNDATLTWSSVPYATGYKIYQVSNGESVLQKTVTTTSATFTGLADGDYNYEVRAYSDRFGESAASTVAFTVEVPILVAPANFAYKLQNGNDIVLTWDAVSNANNYKVYQIVNGQKVLKNTVTGTTVSYTNLPAGDYAYEIHSVSTRLGESAEGSQVSLTLVTPVMQAPANLVQTIKSATEFSLNWDAAPLATSYKIYQIVNGQKVLKSSIATTTQAFTNMQPGDYTYEVHSVSTRFGESAQGSLVTVTMNGQTMNPPTDLTQTIANGNDITLKWTAAQYATSYKVYQVVNGQKVLKSTLAGTTVTYSNQPGGDYDYIVTSVSTFFGESATGAELKFTLDLPVIAAPANLTSKILNANDVVLTWSASAYANSYKIYELIAGTEVLKTTTAALTTTLAKVAGGEHTYVVHAVSTRFGESQAGSNATVTVDENTMPAPSNPTSSISNGNDITLKWDAVTSATSYKVYQVINGQKVLKSSPTAATATYTNQPAGDYTYEVHSVSTRFGESPEGSTVNLTVVFPTMQAPGPVTQTITNLSDINLKWTAALYATAYKVYRIIDGQKVLQKTVTTPAATFTKSAGGTYTFEVHAYSDRFGESTEGSSVTFDLVLSSMVPPTTLTQTIANGNDITLKWNVAPNATAYKVYQVVDDQLVLKSTVTGTQVTYVNQPEGDYTYEVHSFSDRLGESPEGIQDVFTLTFPTMQPPASLTTTVANGNDVTLKWPASQYATSYKLYQVINGEKTLLKTLTGLTNTFVNLPAGDYTYEVRSTSTRFGDSPVATVLNYSMVFPTMQAPGTLTQTITNGNDITLKWGTAQYATAYRVYQIVDGQRVLKSTQTTSTLTLTNMPQGDYSYAVYSYSDRFGESPLASTANFTLVWPVVQPPVLKSTVFNANNMTLTWPAVTWGNEYRLYKVTGDTRTLVYKGTALTYTEYNLLEASHSYVVTAYNTRFGESQASNQVTEKIVYPLMQSPTATVKVLSQTSATISWGFVTYANGYNVYEIVDGKPVQLVKNLNNLSYTLTNLPYKNHEYYVTSYSNSFGESQPSNTVLAKLVVDTQAPVTMATAPTAWTNQSTVVTLTASDDITGVAKTLYSVNGSAFVEGTSITVNQEGVNQISFYSVDKVGNTEATKSISVKIDKTAPVTQASQAASVVTLTATDAQSGVAKTFYSVNGATYVEGTTVTVDQEGVNTVSYYSVDQAGNRETAQSLQVSVDKTAPVTKSDAPTIWSATDVKVTLSATDDRSGVAKTYYSVNGSDFAEGTTVTVDREGVNKISFYSVDKSGNQEATQTVEVKLDKAAPTTASAQADGKVTLTATDAQSGVAKTFYSINGSAFVEGTTVTVDQEGINKVSYYSVDVAGNKEDAQSLEVTVDKTAPVTTSHAPTNWSAADVQVTLSATDNLTGVAKTYYSVNGSDFAEGTTVTVNQEGVNKISFYSVDKSGNQEATQTVEVKLDKAAPTTASVQADGKVTLTATDAQSGVAKTFYSINGSDFVEGTTVTVDQEGINKVSYYSVDVAGNKEDAQSLEVTVDKTAPVTTSEAPTTWSAADVQVILSATDNLTGVAKTYYSVNGSDFAEGTTVTVDREGVNKISFYSVDKSGNKETTHTVEVKLDKAAPTTASAQADGKVTLTATDAQSGVAKTFYSINGSDFVEGTTVTVDQEGINKVSYYSVDVAGNKEDAQSLEVTVDKTAPVTTSDAPTSWSAADVQVTLSATDNLTGVAKTYYSVNGSDFAEGTTVTVDREGVNKISFYSVDKSGNQEATQTVEVKLDKAAPTTASAQADGKVTLTATDAQSGVAKTFYSINGSAFVEGTTVTVDQEGINKVSYYSVDVAGNKEDAQSLEVTVDKTAPVTTSEAPTTWSAADVQVTLSATDNLTGVAKTYYSVNGSDFAEGTTVTVNQEGVNKISFYSVDKSGNKETTHTVEVKLDKAAPTTKSNAISGWVQAATVTLTTTDAQSGVAKTYYSVNGSTYVAGTTFTVDKEGVNKVTYYAVDIAGNQEQVQTLEVKVDKTAPVTTSDAQSTGTAGDMKVTLASTDSMSGVAKTFYSVDGGAYMEGTSFTLTNGNTGTGTTSLTGTTSNKDSLEFWGNWYDWFNWMHRDHRDDDVPKQVTHKVAFYSTDVAGNVEAVHTVDVKTGLAAPVITMDDLQAEYRLGLPILVSYKISVDSPKIVSSKLTISGPGGISFILQNNGLLLTDKPGVYTAKVTVTDINGKVSTLEKQFVVYIGADIDVTPGTIKGNKGEFTVRVNLPFNISTQGFDLDSVRLNGVKALTSNNGYYNQAKNGQFKFERSNFTWTGSEVKLEFRGYVNGNLVIGQTTVKVQK